MVSTPPHAGFSDNLFAGAVPLSSTSTPESGYFDSVGHTADYSHVSCPFYPSSEEDSGIVSQDSSLLVSLSSGRTATPGPSAWRRNVRRSHIDFLVQLQGIVPAISKLLAYLSDRDLAMVCCTSGEWRRVCQSVCEARQRWERYIKVKRDIWESSRENLPCKRPLVHRSEDVPHPLAVRNSNSSSGDSDKAQAGTLAYTSRFQIYVEEAKHLKEDEQHLACPKCNYPSRISRGATCATCKSPSCQYRFCGQCKRPWHEPDQPCPELSVADGNTRSKKPVIGGERSRRKLRRL
ncbi:unnamed protein product [Ixodes hexagonus]